MIKQKRDFDFDDLKELASREGIPLLDLLMIAVNREGARVKLPYPRARMQIRPLHQDEVWQIILPLDNKESPFSLEDHYLLLRGVPVAELVACENDDVVLTYLRANGRSLTLNTNSRSSCTGCIFCPNIIEDAADDCLSGVAQFEELLGWTAAEHGWLDLSQLEVITVCSGCFNTADAAISHLTDLRVAAGRLRFNGRLHLLSSVVRSRSDLRILATDAAPFHLTLTLECFTRRNLLLKSSKASLTIDEACRILNDCADLGVVGDFTYVAGLDPLEIAVSGLRRLAEHVSTFPRIQVLQAHNNYMRQYRDPGARRLSYYLDLRRAIEDAFAMRGFRPRTWENYRPLWYTQFAGGHVEGPRI